MKGSHSNNLMAGRSNFECHYFAWADRVIIASFCGCDFEFNKKLRNKWKKCKTLHCKQIHLKIPAMKWWKINRNIKKQIIRNVFWRVALFCLICAFMSRNGNSKMKDNVRKSEMKRRYKTKEKLSRSEEYIGGNVATVLWV